MRERSRLSSRVGTQSEFAAEIRDEREAEIVVTSWTRCESQTRDEKEAETVVASWDSS